MVDFEFKAYRRPFAQAYATASDAMARRSGILLRLRDGDGRTGFGEVAPIESFGSESFVSALAACADLKGKIEYRAILPDLESFPCLRFGIESAFAMLESESYPPELDEPWAVCGLLPNLGDTERLERLMDEGYRCLKIKIGKGSFQEERAMVGDLFERTDGAIPLRLDANGSLDLRAARDWLEFLADTPAEFLEQPLAKGEERTMQALAQDYPTPIALDESVCSVDDLKRWKDAHWDGVFVVKPSLSGGRRSLINELKSGERESVALSSALETMVGTAAALSVAIEAGEGGRPLGFGVDALFADSGVSAILGPFLQRTGMPALDDFETLWDTV